MSFRETERPQHHSDIHHGDLAVNQISSDIRLALAVKDFPRAESFIPKISEIHPTAFNHIEHRLCLEIIVAKVLAKKKVNMPGVKGYIADLREKYPNDGKIHFLSGEFFHAIGKYADAAEYYKIAETSQKLSRSQVKLLPQRIADCEAHLQGNGAAPALARG